MTDMTRAEIAEISIDPTQFPRETVAKAITQLLRQLDAANEALAAIDKDLPAYLTEIAKTMMNLTAEADAANARADQIDEKWAKRLQIAYAEKQATEARADAAAEQMRERCAARLEYHVSRRPQTKAVNRLISALAQEIRAIPLNEEPS